MNAYRPHASQVAPAHTKPEVRSLCEELRRTIHGEVRFDAATLALYSTDASNYRQIPIGIVIPRVLEDVIAAVDLCRQSSVPILTRGAGTSLAGQGCNEAIVIDFSKYLNSMIALDPVTRLARVEPGLICDDLRRAAEQHALTFGPDPSTHQYCTLGGMIGNNSCGVHSVMAGKTAENTEELEILTYDGLRLQVGATSDADLSRIIQEGGRRGEIYSRLKNLRDTYADLIRKRFPRIPRRVSGYNLDQLLPENGFQVARALVGSEGTCVVVLQATVRLVHSPRSRCLVVLGFDDVFVAADHVPEILESKPIGLEGMDGPMIDNMKRKSLHLADVSLFPPGDAWLMVEFGGETPKEAADRARGMIARFERLGNGHSAKLYEDTADQKKLWAVRESGIAATSFVPGENDLRGGWEDAAVAPANVGGYLRELHRLTTRYGYRHAIYGHFGDGCIHDRVDFDLKTAQGIATFRRFIEEAADVVVRYGGSFSGEHGDGQSRAELLGKMFGHEMLHAFREFKSIWDPPGKMNPGKVVDPYRLDENLRFGSGYQPQQLGTIFAFPEDRGSLARASERCIGVGKCRKLETGTMCPSFMATREEAYSTRGRARLLFEMLRGDTPDAGRQEEGVKDALDLCLACKACKFECPMKVDMASYKAEFLARYYRCRLRPRSAYALGLIPWWARLAALAPAWANFFTQSSRFAPLLKSLAGVAPARTLPAFARQAFRQWFSRRAAAHSGGPKVLLWPDTFANYFQPEIGQAAVEVLESAGCQVVLPPGNMCCGRPLYDHGMLKLAKRLLRKILVRLRGQIDQGIPIVFLEPSCAAVFRDELLNLFPRDTQAARLSGQSFLLSEFLADRLVGYAPPQLHAAAVVQGHCHHRAVLGFDAETRILERLGLEPRILDSGCCGMAGSFGFETEHYGVSQKIGERVLLPTVRQVPQDTLIVADGFSCREQIAQATCRRPLHLAQVIQLALQGHNRTSIASGVEFLRSPEE